MNRYRLLEFLDELEDTEGRFIVYGLGNLISVVVFPKYISYDQALTDLMLRDLAIYGGIAQFELSTQTKRKNLTRVKIDHYYQSDGRDESSQTNDLYLYLINQWKTQKI